MLSTIKSKKKMSYFPDWLKWMFFWFLISATIFANWYFSERSAPLRLACVIFVGFFVLSLAWSTQTGKKFRHFAKETETEMRKVVWPMRSEVVQSTMMVIVVVALAALFLWGIDSLLLSAMSFFTDQRG